VRLEGVVQGAAAHDGLGHVCRHALELFAFRLVLQHLQQLGDGYARLEQGAELLGEQDEFLGLYRVQDVAQRAELEAGPLRLDLHGHVAARQQQGAGGVCGVRVDGALHVHAVFVQRGVDVGGHVVPVADVAG